jgi:transcription-repair coupling factor (superfamily II helicase)
MSELDSQARTRLETIERFTELGMGMRVAALDMEQRGAGDLLGAEQSGFVASVGFELFCRLLEDATSEAQGRTVVHEVEPDLTVDVEALIPEEYVADVGLRLAFYKQMASAVSSASIDDIALELEDRFGTPPPAARNLIGLMRLKTSLRQLKVLGCNARSNSVDLSLRSDTPINISCIERLESRVQGTYRVTPDSRLVRKARPSECFANGIVHAEFMLAELEECARMAVG